MAPWWWAKPYMDNVNWTKGIDQKTGKPVDYDPARDIQVYSTLANQTEGPKKVCPGHAGGNNYFPVGLQPEDQAHLHPGAVELRRDQHRHHQALAKTTGWNGGNFKTSERYESDLTAVDPITGEVKGKAHMRYPNYAGALATGGGLVFIALLDGTVAAYDDTTMQELEVHRCPRPRR